MEQSKLHPVIEEIVQKAMSDLEDAGLQCMNAVERLEDGGLPGAIGAIAGCEESIHGVNLILFAAHKYQHRLNQASGQLFTETKSQSDRTLSSETTPNRRKKLPAQIPTRKEVNEVATKERMKLVVLYDTNHNEYSISAHNQSADQAQRIVEEWPLQMVPGISLIVLDQSRQHRTPDADHCEACRDTVARSANISPQPTFKRRK